MKTFFEGQFEVTVSKDIPIDILSEISKFLYFKKEEGFWGRHTRDARVESCKLNIVGNLKDLDIYLGFYNVPDKNSHSPVPDIFSLATLINGSDDVAFANVRSLLERKDMYGEIYLIASYYGGTYNDELQQLYDIVKPYVSKVSHVGVVENSKTSWKKVIE